MGEAAPIGDARRVHARGIDADLVSELLDERADEADVVDVFGARSAATVGAHVPAASDSLRRHRDEPFAIGDRLPTAGALLSGRAAAVAVEVDDDRAGFACDELGRYVHDVRAIAFAMAQG